MAVNEGRIGLRRGENLGQAWSAVRLRATLLGDPNRIRSGDTRPLAMLIALRDVQIPLPEMLGHADLPFRVMREVVTGGQFDKLVASGYMPRGNGAATLKKIASNSANADIGIGNMSLDDGRALARMLNRQNPGRKFRVPSESEVELLHWALGGQLRGADFWIWTKSFFCSTKGAYVLRTQNDSFRDRNNANFRSEGYAVRLVEDLAV